MKSLNEIKQIAQTALKSEYGFTPSKRNITITDHNDDGTFILFNINGIKYRFYSTTSKNGVWVGKGSIIKL